MTEFEAQNAGNGIPGLQSPNFNHFPGAGDAPVRYWNEPRSRYKAGSVPGCSPTGKKLLISVETLKTISSEGLLVRRTYIKRTIII